MFSKGNFPQNIHGFYKGSAWFYTGSWQGKRFDQKTNTGINVFGKEDNFRFKTYRGKGVSDPTTSVLKIDYNLESNSYFLRLVLDELVEVKQGKYLGKAILRIIPGLPLTVTYFRLSKD